MRLFNKCTYIIIIVRFLNLYFYKFYKKIYFKKIKILIMDSYKPYFSGLKKSGLLNNDDINLSLKTSLLLKQNETMK